MGVEVSVNLEKEMVKKLCFVFIGGFFLFDSTVTARICTMSADRIMIGENSGIVIPFLLNVCR